MGGRTVRSEPHKLTVSNAARKILENAGWLNYFNHLQESNEAIALEFLQNLQENYSVVGGKRIEVTEDIITEVSVLPAVAPKWGPKKERLQKAMETF